MEPDPPHGKNAAAVSAPFHLSSDDSGFTPLPAVIESINPGFILTIQNKSSHTFCTYF